MFSKSSFGDVLYALAILSFMAAAYCDQPSDFVPPLTILGMGLLLRAVFWGMKHSTDY